MRLVAVVPCHEVSLLYFIGVRTSRMVAAGGNSAEIAVAIVAQGSRKDDSLLATFLLGGSAKTDSHPALVSGRSRASWVQVLGEWK